MRTNQWPLESVPSPEAWKAHFNQIADSVQRYALRCCPRWWGTEDKEDFAQDTCLWAWRWCASSWKQGRQPCDTLGQFCFAVTRATMRRHNHALNTRKRTFDANALKPGHERKRIRMANYYLSETKADQAGQGTSVHPENLPGIARSLIEGVPGRIVPVLLDFDTWTTGLGAKDAKILAMNAARYSGREIAAEVGVTRGWVYNRLTEMARRWRESQE